MQRKTAGYVGEMRVYAREEWRIVNAAEGFGLFGDDEGTESEEKN